MTTIVNSLDELKALDGQHLGTSEWVEIEQSRIDQFADATGDHQWIHVDAARAATGPFGTTIAHGYLTLSLIPGLLKDIWIIQGTKMGLNYGLGKVRFPSPVPVGSKVRLDATLASCEVGEDGSATLTIACTIEIDGAAKPALVAEVIYRYKY
jgi:acyl dehydratase